MSSKSNDQGRAFEYAYIMKLKDRIEDNRPAIIDEESVMAAHRAWETQSEAEQHMYLRAADAFIDTLFSAEPFILECDGADDIVILSFRIHNDSTIVEPSLKFDIQFLGLPAILLQLIVFENDFCLRY